ncbi:MAG: hypothetical protein CMJ58_28095 [Planctomycetaceae bacterium]|nr:hypothetical protein [Planctomycetaceae bacterium]
MMLTVKEVAARLRVSGTCVYQLIEKGKLACHRVGCGRGAIRISENDLVAYVATCRQEPSGQALMPARSAHRLRHLRQ